jgi:hypothetical protein
MADYTGNEYGFEGSGAKNQPYQMTWTAGSSTHDAPLETATFRDGNWHTFTIVMGTDFKFYVNGVLRHTAPADPSAAGNKADRMLITNHIYRMNFQGATYAQSFWDPSVAPNGVDMDIEWFRVWRPSTGQHFTPLVTLPDVMVTAGAAVNVTLPAQTTLWGASGLEEYVTALNAEAEQPGIGDNTTSFKQFPAGLTYNTTTRVLSGIMPAEPGALFVVVGVTGNGNTCHVARFRLCTAPVWTGGTAFTWTSGDAVDIDVYQLWSCGRLMTPGSNPKGLIVTGLPSGLTFSAATGRITGTAPASTGSVTLSATNSAGQTSSRTLTFDGSVSGSAGIAAPVLTGSPALIASYDPGNASTLTVDTGRVTTIGGSDGTTRALAQTGTARPTLETRSGRPAMRFTPAELQHLQYSGTTGIGSNACTIVLIAEPAAAGETGHYVDISVATATASLSRHALLTNADNKGWTHRKCDTSVLSDAQRNSPYLAQRTLAIGTSRSGLSYAELNVDGTSSPTFGTGTPASVTNLNTITLGARMVSSAPGAFINAWVFRVLIYGTQLDATQKEEIASWAATNYGTTNAA